MMLTRNARFVAPLALLAVGAGAVTAADIQIKVENPLPEGNFFFTPTWVATHDGSFDVFDSGASAAGFGGLEEVAELGDTAPISDRFANSAAGTAGGQQGTLASIAQVGDPPVYSPGEMNMVMFDAGDATVNRYFSFASMVIPSNDLFFANSDPTAYEIFDMDGNFAGPLTIEIYGMNVYDAGTELNDADGGAAFSTLGGDSVSEDEVVRLFFSLPDASDYLDDFVGTTTASGDTITETFGRDTLIARITITPEPSALMLLAVAGLGLRRRS